MEQTRTWFDKNKFVIVLILGLGLFGLYAWKTNLTFAPYFDKQNPAPYVPDINNPLPVKTNEVEWRRQFENDRK